MLLCCIFTNSADSTTEWMDAPNLETPIASKLTFQKKPVVCFNFGIDRLCRFHRLPRRKAFSSDSVAANIRLSSHLDSGTPMAMAWREWGQWFSKGAIY